MNEGAKEGDNCWRVTQSHCESTRLTKDHLVGPWTLPSKGLTFDVIPTDILICQKRTVRTGTKELIDGRNSVYVRPSPKDEGSGTPEDLGLESSDRGGSSSAGRKDR